MSFFFSNAYNVNLEQDISLKSNPELEKSQEREIGLFFTNDPNMQ